MDIAMKINTKVASKANMYLADKRNWLMTMDTGRYVKRQSHRAERYEIKLNLKREWIEL